MSTAESWSIRGIVQQARRAAKSAAQQEGISLGEWLNKVILEQQNRPNTQYESKNDNQNKPTTQQIKTDSSAKQPSLPPQSISALNLSPHNETSHALHFIIENLINQNIKATTHNLEILAQKLEMLETNSTQAISIIEQTLKAQEGKISVTQNYVEQHTDIIKKNTVLLTDIQDQFLKKSDLMDTNLEENKTYLLNEIELKFNALSDHIEQQQKQIEHKFYQDIKEYKIKLDQTESRLESDFQNQLEKGKTELLKYIHSNTDNLQQNLESAIDLQEINAKLNTFKTFIDQQHIRIDELHHTSENKETNADQELNAFRQSINQMDQKLSLIDVEMKQSDDLIEKQIEDKINQYKHHFPPDGFGEIYEKIKTGLSHFEQKIQDSEEKQNNLIRELAKQVKEISLNTLDADKRLDHLEKNTQKESLNSFQQQLEKIENDNTQNLHSVSEKIADIGEYLSKCLTQSEERTTEALEDIQAQFSEYAEQKTGESISEESSETSINPEIVNELILTSQQKHQMQTQKALNELEQKLEKNHDSQALKAIQASLKSLTSRLSSLENITIQNYENQNLGSNPVGYTGETIQQPQNPETGNINQDETSNTEKPQTTGHQEIDQILHESENQFSPLSAYANHSEKEQQTQSEHITHSEAEQQTQSEHITHSEAEQQTQSEHITHSETEQQTQSEHITHSETEQQTQTESQNIQPDSFNITDFQSKPDEVQDTLSETWSSEAQPYTTEESKLKNKIDQNQNLEKQDRSDHTQEKNPLNETQNNPDLRNFSKTDLEKNTGTKFKPVFVMSASLVGLVVLGAGGWYVYQKLLPSLSHQTENKNPKTISSSEKTQQLSATMSGDTIGIEEALSDIPSSDISKTKNNAMERTSPETRNQNNNLQTSQDSISDFDATLENPDSEQAFSLNYNPIEPSMQKQETPENLETKLPSNKQIQNLPELEIDPISEIRIKARSGDPIAQYQLALHYKNTNQVQKAFSMMLRSAEAGIVPAQAKLGSFYEHGTGTSVNIRKAIDSYGQAAKAGNRDAMNSLGTIYANLEEAYSSIIKTDYSLAAKWFEKAAVLGLVEAQYNLGMLYEYGYGVPKNAPDAYAWYSIAAISGDQEAEKEASRIRKELPESIIESLDRVTINFKAEPMDHIANGIFKKPINLSNKHKS